MQQDTAKIDEVEKETAESTVLIPKMEAEVVQLTEQLGEEEKALEALQEGCKGKSLYFEYMRPISQTIIQYHESFILIFGPRGSCLHDISQLNLVLENFSQGVSVFDR